MKAYLIARVSTDEQADALPGQVYRLTDYASRKGYSYELFEIKESAYKSERTSFKRVIGKLSNNDGACVVVFDKIDRYTRNSNSEEVSLLNAMCRVGQIELHFPSDNLYITKNSSAQEHFMLNMGVSTAQYYSDSIRDNVNRRIQQKLRDGEWIGRAPIGYKNIRDEHAKAQVIVDTQKAPAVKEAFELYASGHYSLYMIATVWQEKYGLRRNANMIAHALHNPFYCGFMVSGGQRYPHKYETIVNRELFEKVQERFSGYRSKPQRWQGIEFEYRGLITCAECNATITFERHKGKYVYGKCARERNAAHAKAYVPETAITRQLKSMIESVHIPDEAYAEISKELTEYFASQQVDASTQRISIESELAKYKTRKERMYEDYLDGKISSEFYERKHEEYTKSEALLQERLENIELKTEEYATDVFSLLKLANEAPKLFEKANQMQKRRIISTVLSNLQLSGKELRWEYKKPFDLMAFCHNTSIWYPG